jgi:hypothetical protein
MTTRSSQHTAYLYVGRVIPELVQALKVFAGRNELNAVYNAEENEFWGTLPAINLLRAFQDGWFACLVNASLELKK